MKPKFYVYTLSDPDGRVFYVGKGSGGRVSNHEREARGGCACVKCERIRGIWAGGGVVVRSIVFRDDNERLVLNKERDLIKKIGRDNLCNRSDGGDGAAARKQRVIISATEFKRREMKRIRGILVSVAPKNKARRRRELMGEFEDRFRRSIELAAWIEEQVRADADLCHRNSIKFTEYSLYQDYAWITIDTPHKYYRYRNQRIASNKVSKKSITCRNQRLR